MDDNDFIDDILNFLKLLPPAKPPEEFMERLQKQIKKSERAFQMWKRAEKNCKILFLSNGEALFLN